MNLLAVSYQFTQRFPFPAAKAYRWCVDYRPDDVALMGSSAKRKIERIAKDALILSDSYYSKEKGRSLTKKKLVRLNPRALSWTNTHLAGPIQYSQFLYKIVPEGKKASRLVFTGLQLDRTTGGKNATPSVLAAKYRKEDAATWKLLAKAMRKDLSGER